MKKLKLQLNKQNKYLSYFKKFLIVVFWLVVWQLIAMIINKQLVLASPIAVLKSLFGLLKTKIFYQSIFKSITYIIGGFLLGFILSIIFGTLAIRFKILKDFLSPIVVFLKSVPVVSFIVILLVAITNISTLPLIISCMMVFPVIYTAVLTGYDNIDKKLLQMADIFKVGKKKRFLYIYISNIFPYVSSACKVSLGLCWKSGVAAEVIGIVKNTIGEQMFLAKQYLIMSEVFAWTFTIIFLSILFEFLFMRLIKVLQKRIEQ